MRKNNKRLPAAKKDAAATDLKRAEETLRQSEQRYRTVADYTYDWEFWMSPEGRFNYVSPSVERITGRQVSPNDRAEDFFRQIVPPEDLQARLEHLEAELAGHGPGELEFRILRPDGEVRWVHHLCQPIHDAEGRFFGTRGSNRDITERKGMKEALSESRRRLTVILDSIADGFYALDRDWRVTHTNDDTLRHMGKTREEVIGHTLFELFPTVRGSVTESEYRRAMESGEPVHFESPSIISDKILEIHAYPTPESLTVLFRDVTERSGMETALREAHERAEWLARFPEENPNPVMRVSTDGRVLFCNPASTKMPGWACEVGRQLSDPLRPLLERAVADRKDTQQDVELGGRFYSVTVVPILQEGYSNIYGRDTTDRKRAEEQITRSQKMFSELIQRAPFGIYIVDSQFRVAQANPVSQDGVFCNVRPVIGRDFAEAMRILWPEPVAAEIITHFRHTLETGEPYYSPPFIKTRHDVEIVESYEWELHRMMLPDRQYGVICYYFDSTKLREAEDKLQTTLHRMNTFVANMHAPTLLVGADGRVVFANQAFCNYFELKDSPADLVGTENREMIERVRNAYLHPDEEVVRIKEILSQMEAVTGEEIILRDGKTCLRDFIPIYADGKLHGRLWQHTDITAGKQAEMELRESEERTAFALETSWTGTWDLDLVEHTAFRSEFHDRIFGYKSLLPQWTYEMFLEHVLPEDRGMVDREFRHAIETKTDWNFECRIRRTDGEIRWIWAAGRHKPDTTGKMCRMAGIVQDITERKEKESRIAKLTRLYAALSRVNEAIVRVRDEVSLYDEVCQILSEEGNFPLVWIGQVKEKQVIPAAWYGAASGYLKEIKVETEGRFGQGPTGTSVRENRAVINGDFATSPAVSPWRKTAINFGFRSSAAFPLARGGKAVASLTVYSSVADVFDAEQVRLLESLSADISYALDALDQERLRRAADEAVRGSEEHFRLLSSTAGRLLRADDPQAIVEDLCRDVMAYLDCQTFFNFLVDEKAGRLRLNACAGIPQEEARAIEWLDYGVAVCGCVAQARQRIIAEDILHTPDVRTDLVKSFGIQAYCCHPLMAQDRLIGTLSFGTKTRAHFTPEEVELMRIVTDQVAVAMQRKQAEDELTRLNQELEQRVNERTAELRAASLYSRSLIEASLDPLVTISPEGKIMDVNEATEQVTGRTRGQLIGTDFSNYFTEPGAAQAGYRKVLADGQVRDYPLTIRDASGNKTDVLYNATVYRNAQGEVQGVFAAARDVTETKRVEAELAKHREHLEDMVKERTAELEAANKELESFSYSVSHDLRAPLRAIDGYARMILKKEGDGFDEETMRKFNVIRSSSQMMGQLIDDILTLSRVVKKHLSASQLEIDTIIRDVWKELETINPERKMELTVRDIPVSNGDRTLIRQVYANLLSNAVKFTKDRDPALIETGGYVEGNENVYYIRDNGVGFEMEYYDKLFGIFQRLHKADEFEGTGVGLATVQRIVQRHGGRVWAEGKVNEGATFYFTLPRKR